MWRNHCGPIRQSSLKTIGGMSDEGLGCAFVAGLPDSTRQILRAGARMESLKLSEVVDRARAILREENGALEVAAALAKGARSGGDRGRTVSSGRRERGPCFTCGRLGHLARECSAPTGPRVVRCFRCDKIGHIAVRCPENAEREEDRAPASSRD